MRVLGIKCSKAELGWIVIEGTTRSDATVVASERPKVPPGERDLDETTGTIGTKSGDIPCAARQRLTAELAMFLTYSREYGEDPAIDGWRGLWPVS
jgi:hypothetical protein